jgi:hypothetical protein
MHGPPAPAGQKGFSISIYAIMGRKVPDFKRVGPISALHLYEIRFVLSSGEACVGRGSQSPSFRLCAHSSVPTKSWILVRDDSLRQNHPLLHLPQNRKPRDFRGRNRELAALTLSKLRFSAFWGGSGWGWIHWTNRPDHGYYKKCLISWNNWYARFTSTKCTSFGVAAKHASQTCRLGNLFHPDACIAWAGRVAG